LPAAASALADFTSGGFRPLIEDPETSNYETVNRIVLCSGKVYYDLVEARKKADNSVKDQVSIVRLEQFYPFPQKRLRELLAKYPAASQLVWAQEEPKNMGGWTFIEQHLENLLPRCERAIYVGRSPSASPATGSYAIHQAEQAKLIAEALAL